MRIAVATWQLGLAVIGSRGDRLAFRFRDLETSQLGMST
jgi:hypothetical protein